MEKSADERSQKKYARWKKEQIQVQMKIINMQICRRRCSVIVFICIPFSPNCPIVDKWISTEMSETHHANENNERRKKTTAATREREYSGTCGPDTVALIDIFWNELLLRADTKSQQQHFDKLKQ